MRAAPTVLFLTAAILLMTGSLATAASPEEIAAEEQGLDW